MSVTPQAFHFHLNKLADTEKYLIAYSGGVDSHVLLHLCSQLKNSPSGFDQTFSAVYIDHGLSFNSAKWGKHCQHICFELDIPLTIIEVDATPKKGQSPEAAARTARYRALSKILEKDECLLTAQHQDDQAETLLLQLLRGSGTRGLSAMPRIKPFAKGYLCRPMLDFNKKDIMAYAHLHQLEWIEDESNQDQRYDRNYLRHEILPRLESRWPALQENLAKSAEVLAESQALLDEMARVGSQNLYVVNELGVEEQDKLMIEPLRSMRSCKEERLRELPYHCQHRELARLNNILRHWINLNYLPLPSKKILEQIVHSVIFSKDDAMPVVQWHRDSFHCEIRKYRDKLYLIDISGKPATDTRKADNKQYELTESSTLELKGGSQVKLSPAKEFDVNQGFNRDTLLSQPLTLRYRKGGERFRRSMDSQSSSLKHWFQEQGIPPWERNTMPLIYWGNQLIQVGNIVVNHELMSEELNNSLVIHWEREI